MITTTEKHVKPAQMIVEHVGLTIVEMEYVKNILEKQQRNVHKTVMYQVLVMGMDNVNQNLVRTIYPVFMIVVVGMVFVNTNLVKQ